MNAVNSHFKGSSRFLMSHLVSQVVSSGYCTGCGFCASIASDGAIKMEHNKAGFLRPVVFKNTSKEETEAIDNFCPGINIKHSSKASNYHNIWGPIVDTRTGYSTNDEVRNTGSSGGVISALAIFLLQEKKVDFIAQIAVSEDDPFKNEIQLSTTYSQVLRAAGSRYAPSAPLENIIDLLQLNKKFAFIGKPCDVAALRMYLNVNPQYKANVQYLISFMCAGIPSTHGTDAVLKKMGVTEKENVISFKYRGDGWPGNATAVLRSGDTFKMDYNSSWGNILGKHLQMRCKLCPDGTGEFADVVCADAWYGKDGYPDFTERDGRSLIITRTSVGESLVNEAFDKNAIFIENIEASERQKMQPSQLFRKKVVLGRVLVAGFVNKKIPKYKNMGLVRASLMINPYKWIRSAFGTYLRLRKERC